MLWRSRYKQLLSLQFWLPLPPVSLHIGAQGLVARDDQAQAAQQNTQQMDQAASSQQVQDKQQQAAAAGTQEQQDAKAKQGQLSDQQQQDAQQLAATNAWCYDQNYGYYSCGPYSYYDQHVCQNTYNGLWYYCSYNDWYQQYYGYSPPQCYYYYNGYAYTYPCNGGNQQGSPSFTESASVNTPFGTFSGSRTTAPDSSNPNGGTSCTYDSNGNVISCIS
ncbi:hypothetical protein BST61_g2689 [Cercospora zeina]